VGEREVARDRRGDQDEEECCRTPHVAGSPFRRDATVPEEPSTIRPRLCAH
jgi:hypothetical protein